MINIEFSDLEKNLNFNTVEEKEILRKAYDINKCSSKTNKNVCKLTAIDLFKNFHADKNTILASLIYKGVKQLELDYDKISGTFNEDVASKVKMLNLFDDDLLSHSENNKIQTIKSIAVDVKVTIIKLVERLNTLRYMNKYLSKISIKSKNFISDTLNFYIPVCQLIGIHELQIELENICFKDNKNYGVAEEIKNKVKEKTDEIIKLIDPTLSQVGATLIQNRRSNYDILLRSQELKRKVKEFNNESTINMSEFCSIKCLVESPKQCYEALYLIHDFRPTFKPIMGSCIDYLPGIQGNEYRAIHTYVFINSCLVDFRVCTKEMDVINSYGVCSNWDDGIDFNKRLESNYKFYPILLDLIKHCDDCFLVEEFKNQILDGQIYQTDQEEVKKQKILKIMRDNLKNNLF